MVTRVHFCARCQRPIFTNNRYCPDCQALLASPIMSTPRCSHCGKTKDVVHVLYWNRKLKKNYCSSCLEIFKTALLNQGFTNNQVRRIVREDFIPLSN